MIGAAAPDRCGASAGLWSPRHGGEQTQPPAFSAPHFLVWFRCRPGLPGLLRLGFGLMLRTGVSPSTTKSERRWTVAALGRLLGRRQPLPLRPAAASIDHRLPRADDHALPAIVVRA